MVSGCAKFMNRIPIGPTMGVLRSFSQSTKRSLPFLDKNWAMEARIYLRRSYAFNRLCNSPVCFIPSSSFPKTYASSIAIAPPCPRFGIVGWQASPIRATLPSTQPFTIGKRSNRGRRFTTSGEVASNRSWISGLQSANSLFKRSSIGSLSFPTPLAVSGGSGRKAHQCCQPYPQSVAPRSFDANKNMCAVYC